MASASSRSHIGGRGCSNIRTQTSETIPPEDIAEWRHSSEGRLTFVVFTMRYMRHTSVPR